LTLSIEALVEIVILVTNGLVFQNDSMSSTVKNTLGIFMLLVILCLMITGLSGEFKRKIKQFKHRKQRRIGSTVVPVTTSELPMVTINTTA
jgi:hypothetical protein